MKQIGLTGNIGSGKTTICRVFEILGIPVFYADKIGRMQLLREDVVDRLTAIFGNGILDQEKSIDRKILASIVFHDKDALQKLNEVIHPLVYDAYEHWISQQKGSYTIHESAILYESGNAGRFDKTIVVTAPLELRIDRVRKRDQASREEVLGRIKNQMKETELVEKADFEIVNDGYRLVMPQILHIDHMLRL